MTIEKITEGTRLIFSLSGRLDTGSAPELEEAVKELPHDLTELIFDTSALEYISSAGLRVLLSAHKFMESRGKMVIRNAGPALMDVFDITGFIDIFNFETIRHS